MSDERLTLEEVESCDNCRQMSELQGGDPLLCVPHNRAARDGLTRAPERRVNFTRRPYGPLPCDWPEDSSHENGEYQCECTACGVGFYGHKRRVTCRPCAGVHPRAQPSESDRERALDHIASSYDSGRVDDIGADAWAGWAADTARVALRSAVCEKSDMERVDDWLHRRTRPGTPDLRMVWDREEKRSLAAEFAAVADRVREECAKECRKVALIEDDAAATAGAAMHMAEERIARHGREIAFVIMRRILDAAPEGEGGSDDA